MRRPELPPVNGRVTRLICRSLTGLDLAAAKSCEKSVEAISAFGKSCFAGVRMHCDLYNVLVGIIHRATMSRKGCLRVALPVQQWLIAS